LGDKPVSAMVIKFTIHEPAPPAPPKTALASPATAKWWAEQVEEKTQGRVKVDIKWAGVLGRPPDYVKMIGNPGVADAGQVIGAYHTWETPLRCAAGLPFLTTGLEALPKALDKLYKDWPAMQEELKKVNLKLMFNGTIHGYWMSLNLKKAPTTLGDLAGKKINGPGYYNRILARYDIAQVSVSAPAAYEALQRGVIVGKISPLHVHKLFSYYEVCKTMVDLEFIGGQSANMYAMNLDVWNKISPKDQKAIESVNAVAYDHLLQLMYKERDSVFEFLKKRGVKLVKFSPEEQSRTKDKCAESIWDEWIKDTKKRGIPGEEFLKRYRAALK
jgi:TRAP-type C4-dicarboxylate transport system substrate-binding protein